MTKTILIIDDENELVEMVTMRLEANGYNVLSAGNGVQGLEKAKLEQPDLILLDVLMPEMDGYDTLDKLKEGEETRLIPVIMFTVERQSEDIKQSLKGGAEDHVVKPFAPEELISKIKDILDE